MTLEDLDVAVHAALKKCAELKIDPKDVPLLVSTSETPSEEATEIEFEEFPDDNEEYRQHVRAGGKREFRFEISADVD